MRAAQLNDVGVVVNFAEVKDFGGAFIDPKDAQFGSTWDKQAGQFTHPAANSEIVKTKFNADIDAKIVDLESSITVRRLRETILTGDKTFLQAIDTQIADLRAQRK